MIRSSTHPYHLADLPTYRHRLRLAATVTLLASAIGASAILISSASRTRLYAEPEHLPPLPAAFFALAGVIAGALIAAPLVYRLCDRTDQPRGIVWWSGLGLGFGVLLPLATAALLPLSILSGNVARGLVAIGELPSMVLEVLFLAPASILIDGMLGLNMAVPAAVAGAAGAWVIDRLNSAGNPSLARYGPWVVAVLAGVALIAIATLSTAPMLEQIAGKRLRVGG
ncbi:MAG: hypothetical protein V3S18_01660 [Dehalococcoidia bacterium]